jgi:phage terminase small subunit
VGRRGPAPTPTAVKRLRGETRPSRLNLREPMPSADLPKMPADMDPAAKAVWRRVLRDMRHTGVIRSADADVLRCYCWAPPDAMTSCRIRPGVVQGDHRGRFTCERRP